jgi:hypothetical protein
LQFGTRRRNRASLLAVRKIEQVREADRWPRRLQEQMANEEGGQFSEHPEEQHGGMLDLFFLLFYFAAFGL